MLFSKKYIRPTFMKPTGTNKLRAKYAGPFRVNRKVSAPSYELDLPMNLRVHPVTNLGYLKEYHPGLNNPEHETWFHHLPW